MRDLVAPVLLLLGVGLDALPSLRLVLPELPLVVLPVDGPHDVVEVPGAAQRGDEARERLERGRTAPRCSASVSSNSSSRSAQPRPWVITSDRFSRRSSRVAK